MEGVRLGRHFAPRFAFLKRFPKHIFRTFLKSLKIPSSRALLGRLHNRLQDALEDSLEDRLEYGLFRVVGDRSYRFENRIKPGKNRKERKANRVSSRRALRGVFERLQKPLEDVFNSLLKKGFEYCLEDALEDGFSGFLKKCPAKCPGMCPDTLKPIVKKTAGDLWIRPIPEIEPISESARCWRISRRS